MAESGCKCKSLSIHRPDTSGYLMYHTSNLCIIHQILCIGTISSDTSCIIHQILDVYLHLHPDERLAPNFAIHGAIHILYSDTAYTAIHGDTAYRMYHPPSDLTAVDPPGTPIRRFRTTTTWAPARNASDRAGRRIFVWGGSRFLAEERVISFIYFIEIEISQKFLCPSQNRGNCSSECIKIHQNTLGLESK